MSAIARRTIFYLLMLFVASCSLLESDEPEPKEDPVKTLDLEVQLFTDSLKPAEILILQIVSGDHPEQDSLQASIGNLDFSFFITDTSTLISRVPTFLPEGQHTISSEDFRNSVTVNILKGGYVGDPEEYLDNFTKSFAREVKDNIDSVADPVQYNYFNKQLSELQTALGNLTDEEKALVATVIANESQELNAFESALSDYESEEAASGGRTADCGYSCKLLKVAAVATLATAAFTTVTTGALVGAGVIVAGKCLNLKLELNLSRYQKLAVDYFSDGDFWPHDETVTEAFNYAERKLFTPGPDGGRLAESKLVVVEGEPMEIEFYPTYRAFDESDAHSDNPVVAQLVSAHLTIGKYWDDNMPDETGDFFHLEPKRNHRMARNPDGLRVEVISSSDGFDKISITQQEGIPNDYKVYFDSEDDSDQELTFKVIYEEDGVVAYEETITADFWSLDYEAWHAERSEEELKFYNYLIGNGMSATDLTIESMQYVRQNIHEIQIKENIGLSVLGGLDLFKVITLIEIQNNGGLSALDLSEANTNYHFNLHIVNCALNWIDLGGHSFYSLSLQGTNLTTLDLGNCDLLYLHFYNNPQLTSITGLNMANLHLGGRGIEITLHSNRIAEANWANPFIRVINISNEPINSMDISQCKQLKGLGIEEAPNLTSLHLNNIDSLYGVSLKKTGISDFTVTGSPELNTLRIDDSKLSALNLSSIPKLQTLSARNNMLADVTLNGVSNLEYIYAENNKLSALDICSLGNLKRVDVTQNEFSKESLQTILSCHGESVIVYNCTTYAGDECPEEN